MLNIFIHNPQKSKQQQSELFLEKGCLYAFFLTTKAETYSSNKTLEKLFSYIFV